MPRRASRADATQPEIVSALRAVGAEVTHLHTVGQGVPDLLVWFRRQWFVIEAKRPGGRLTADELDYGLRHPGGVGVVFDVEGALNWIGAVEYRMEGER